MSSPIKYKDTVAAPGSKLHAALEANDLKLAEKIYKECEQEYRKYFPVKVQTVKNFEYSHVSLVLGPNGKPEYVLAGKGELE